MDASLNLEGGIHGVKMRIAGGTSIKVPDTRMVCDSRGRGFVSTGSHLSSGENNMPSAGSPKTFSDFFQKHLGNEWFLW